MKLTLIAALMIIGAAQTQAADDFRNKLAKDCLILQKNELKKTKLDFAKKKIFIVYYSHTYCSVCKKYTKFLNGWYEDEAKKFPQAQMIFATRGDDTRKGLTAYIKNSEIKYPALDEKYYVAADIKNTADPHPFYSDADMGVPRIRFFDETGKELSVKKYVKNIYDSTWIYDLSKMLKKLKNQA